jgi:hypothetical protein
MKAFFKEALVQWDLDHQHIVPFLGISQNIDGSALCTIFPWYNNGTLEEHLKTKPVSAEELYQWVNNYLRHVFRI